MKAVMYHYVREEDDQLPFFRYLHVTDFEQQIKWMNDNGGFVSYPEFTRYLQGEEAPSGYLLTFDDGLKDHVEFVLPVLKKYRLWGIFFGCSRPACDRAGVLEAHIVHYLMGIWSAKITAEKLEHHLKVPLTQLVPEQAYSWQTSDWNEKAVKYVLNYALNPAQRVIALDELLIESGTDREQLTAKLYLNQRDYKELADNGMVVAAHTHSHPVLSKLSESESMQEISDSVRYFDRFRDSAQPLGFCFPYGVEGTFGTTQLEQLGSLNVNFCFAVRNGEITRASNRLNLPRYDCNHFPHGLSTLGLRTKGTQ